MAFNMHQINTIALKRNLCDYLRITFRGVTVMFSGVKIRTIEMQSLYFFVLSNCMTLSET